MTEKANIYPGSETNPTIRFSDSSKQNIGICFSGGGTRALTCAWGQYLGLQTLGLEDKARYISSVSRGTWASSVYHFLPESVSTDELLGKYYNPGDLSLDQQPGKLNMNSLGEHSFGKGPEGSQLKDVLRTVAEFLIFQSHSDRNWLWASVVAKFILEPFGLRFEGDKPWLASKSFTLSEDFVSEHFPPQAPSKDDFVFLRKGRPFLVMNNNLIKKTNSHQSSDQTANVVMLPNHSTPVATGSKGGTPEGYSRNGQVSSFGNNALLAQSSAVKSPVEIELDHLYSLIDSVSTSSAFFADALVSFLLKLMDNEDERKQFVQELHTGLKDEHKNTLLGRFENDLGKKKGDLGVVWEWLEKELLKVLDSLDLQVFVPRYNVWPLGETSSNETTLYTDGGSLENTGILGLLAQTDEGSGSDPLKVLAFDNTSTPLTKVSGQVIAAGQIAPLFGVNFSEKTGIYSSFTAQEKDPNHGDFIATSLIQVFDNSVNSEGKTPFDLLVQGLYDSNSDKGKAENSAPAWHQLQLVTVENSLAAVSANRSVTLLYAQNAKMLNWQNAIGDTQLKNEILEGQKPEAPGYASFKNFPYYDLFFKIGLQAKESNGLSQMWAWAVSDDTNGLNTAIKGLFTR